MQDCAIALTKIINEFGQEAIKRPNLVNAALMDYGISRREINLILTITKSQMFSDFLAEQKKDTYAQNILIHNLANEYPIDEEFLRRGVISLSKALNIPTEEVHEDGVDQLWYKWYQKTAIQGYGKAKEFEPIPTSERAQNYKDDYINYRKQSESGDSQSQVKLGLMYINGLGVEKDFDTGIKWLMTAANNDNNIQAMNSLGTIFEEGIGTSIKYSEAFKWYKKAAEHSDPYAINSIGWIYQNGYGVAQNYFEAFKWYKIAADLNYACALYNMGYMYERGYGVQKDLNEAFRWYTEAAKQDDVDALRKIAGMIEQGRGTDASPREALKYYKRAVDKGDTEAMICMGNLYEKGVLLKKDNAEALVWYKKALKKGNKNALARINWISKKM